MSSFTRCFPTALRLACGALALSCTAALATDDDRGRRHRDPIVGVWNIVTTLYNCDTRFVIAVFPAMALYGDEGTFHDTNATDPRARSDAFGIWRRTGHRQYEWAFRFFRSDLLTGAPVGSTVVRHAVELSDDKESYVSNGRGELFNVDGLSVGGVCSMAQATRFR